MWSLLSPPDHDGGAGCGGGARGRKPAGTGLEKEIVIFFFSFGGTCMGGEGVWVALSWRAGRAARPGGCLVAGRPKRSGCQRFSIHVFTHSRVPNWLAPHAPPSSSPLSLFPLFGVQTGGSASDLLAAVLCVAGAAIRLLSAGAAAGRPPRLGITHGRWCNMPDLHCMAQARRVEQHSSVSPPSSPALRPAHPLTPSLGRVMCGGVMCSNLDGFVTITVAPDASSLAITLRKSALLPPYRAAKHGAERALRRTHGRCRLFEHPRLPLGRAIWACYAQRGGEGFLTSHWNALLSLPLYLPPSSHTMIKLFSIYLPPPSLFACLSLTYTGRQQADSRQTHFQTISLSPPTSGPLTLPILRQMPAGSTAPLFTVTSPAPTMASSTWSNTQKLRPKNLPKILEYLRTGEGTPRAGDLVRAHGRAHSLRVKEPNILEYLP